MREMGGKDTIIHLPDLQIWKYFIVLMLQQVWEADPSHVAGGSDNQYNKYFQ